MKNLKDEIEGILDLHFTNRNHYNFSGLLEAITSLIEQEKGKAVRGFVEEYKKWLIFIPREYDRESIKNSLAVTTDRYLTQQSLDKGDTK